jgi:glycosyltransferase involved in cell wall biosynthesis
MKILFVAMPDSIHVARWISQVTDQGWEIYLFPAYRAKPINELRNITVFGSDPLRPSSLDKSVRLIRWTSIYFYRDSLENLTSHKSSMKNKELALVKAIKLIKPDIVHSLEFQHSCYLTLGAKKRLGNKLPIWIVTNWGSDLYLFGRLTEHQPFIQQILQNCDYYSCECERDVRLATEMGLTGSVLPVLPNGGGIHVEQAMDFRQAGPPSKRKTIILKGYQNWAGRALIAFQAFRLCLDVLQDFTITIYSASDDVKIAANLFMIETGISVEIIHSISHTELLKRFGKARIYIGLSLSDGISTSLLEAMVMGAFPIQSCTACADEWIENGKSGYIVPPEEPHTIAEAIRSALTDNDMVDLAAEINTKVARERLDYSIVQPQVVKMYQKIFETIKGKK